MEFMNSQALNPLKAKKKALFQLILVPLISGLLFYLSSKWPFSYLWKQFGPLTFKRCQIFSISLHALKTNVNANNNKRPFWNKRKDQKSIKPINKINKVSGKDPPRAAPICEEDRFNKETTVHNHSF